MSESSSLFPESLEETLIELVTKDMGPTMQVYMNHAYRLRSRTDPGPQVPDADLNPLQLRDRYR